jgi:hypothetical protein
MRDAVTAIEQHRVWPRLDAVRERVMSLTQSPTKLWASLVLLAGRGLGLLVADGPRWKRQLLPRRRLGTDACRDRSGSHRRDDGAAPRSPAQRALDDTRRQIAQRKLTAPEDGNAYSSALAAWHADSTNPEVHRVIGELTNALADDSHATCAAGKRHAGTRLFRHGRRARRADRQWQQC